MYAVHHGSVSLCLHAFPECPWYMYMCIWSNNSFVLVLWTLTSKIKRSDWIFLMQIHCKLNLVYRFFEVTLTVNIYCQLSSVSYTVCTCTCTCIELCTKYVQLCVHDMTWPVLFIQNFVFHWYLVYKSI